MGDGGGMSSAVAASRMGSRSTSSETGVLFGSGDGPSVVSGPDGGGLSSVEFGGLWAWSVPAEPAHALNMSVAAAIQRAGRARAILDIDGGL